MLALLLPFAALAADSSTLIEPYPGSIVVRQSEDATALSHQIITGSIERVNTRLVPESSEYVEGKKLSITYQILNESRSRVISNYFKEQLVKIGQILFECKGRNCGSSNHWANSVFKRAVLYGPEQYQHYYLAKIATDQTYYVVVYIAQRGTGKLYAHLELISTVDSQIRVDSKQLISALDQQHKYVFSINPDEKSVAVIVDAITATDSQFALVAHDSLLKDETAEAAIKRTREIAEMFRSRLIEKGVPSSRVSAFGAGPIAPLDRDRISRLELVVLDNE